MILRTPRVRVPQVEDHWSNLTNSCSDIMRHQKMYHEAPRRDYEMTFYFPQVIRYSVSCSR
jgi:hypothetical protein